MLGVRDILDLYDERVRHYSSVLMGMDKVRKVYDGEVTLNLPDVDGYTKPPVPNLLAQGVDQMGGRIASTIPAIRVVPQKTIRREERRAQTAKRVLAGWWAADRLPLKLEERAKHLVAYGANATMVTWKDDYYRPCWQVRSPLHALPAPDPHHKHPIPRDILFGHASSAGDLRKQGYGAQVYAITKDADTADHTLLTVIEYVSADQRSLVLRGQDHWGNQTAILLEHDEHHLGITPATYVQRTGLESLAGQFDQMIGMYEAQAMLMALEIIAVEKGIFPDTYLESRQGEVAKFIDGPHDGRTGLVNIVAGGTIREIASSPGYLTNPTIDRLERNQRVSGGIPPEFGGESGTNLRTGRRGDAVLSSTIDMPIAYAQKLLADSLEAENEIAAAWALHFDRYATRTLTKGLGNIDRPVTYVADVVFGESRDNDVAYPAAGSDINQLIVGLGQRVGLGIMSKQTAAQLDPFIDNAEVEHDRIVAEGLENALLAGIQQQAAQGAIPPLTLARVMHLVETDRLELAEALAKVAEEAQAAQQAEQMNAEQMAAGPGAAAITGNPQAAQGMSPVPGAGPGPADFTSLLASLRMPLAGMQNRVGAQPTGAVGV